MGCPHLPSWERAPEKTGTSISLTQKRTDRKDNSSIHNGKCSCTTHARNIWNVPEDLEKMNKESLASRQISFHVNSSKPKLQDDS